MTCHNITNIPGRDIHLLFKYFQHVSLQKVIFGRVQNRIMGLWHCEDDRLMIEILKHLGKYINAFGSFDMRMKG